MFTFAILDGTPPPRGVTSAELRRRREWPARPQGRRKET